jgi:hypothetical protein
MPAIRFLKAERLSRDASYKNWTGNSTTVMGIFQHLVINTDMITTGCGDFLEIRRQSGNLTPAFAASLSRTIATSVTGFGFPFHHLLPAHVVRHLISGSACDCDLCTLGIMT